MPLSRWTKGAPPAIKVTGVNSANVAFGPHASDDPSDASSDEDKTRTPVVAAPDLKVAVTRTPTIGTAGQYITYSLTFANVGNQDASGAELLVEVPASFLSLGSGSTAGWTSREDGKYALPIGLLKAGTSRTVTFKALAAASTPHGTSATLKATISDDRLQGADLVSANNTASITTVINRPTGSRFRN